ncbi:MAG: hypothetical protein MK193_03550 [Lentisphaeria bacterium]|nr:hypothetical protein [Lentisphaeria bacterium]
MFWKHKTIYIVSRDTEVLKELHIEKESLAERDIVWFLKNRAGIQTNFTGPISRSTAKEVRNKLGTLKLNEALLVDHNGQEKLKRFGFNLSHIYSVVDELSINIKRV